MHNNPKVSAFIEKIKEYNIQMVSLDVDGTMTDGGIEYTNDNKESRRFHAHDGFGIQMLQRQGLRVVFITSSVSPIMRIRAKVLNVEDCIYSAHNKGDELTRVAEKYNIPLKQTMHMGDDVNDFDAFDVCGLKVAPTNALPYVQERVDYVTEREGGHGAVRELCACILLAKTGLPYIHMPPRTLPLT